MSVKEGRTKDRKSGGEGVSERGRSEKWRGEMCERESCSVTEGTRQTDTQTEQVL